MKHRRGLRLRIATISALSVGLVLTVGAFVITSTLRSRLDDAATRSAELRARDVAALVQAGALPRTLALPGEESAFVQVVDSSSRVIASTNNVEGEPPISTLRPSIGSTLVATILVEPLSDSATMRVAVLDVVGDSSGVTVYAGENLTDARATVAALTLLLLMGIPLLAGVTGTVTWWAVGRTLRPVQAITTTLADITANDLHRRVPASVADDEIGELTQTVNDTLARLDTAVQTQRRFVADASHELRSPLAALRADLEVSTLHPTVTMWPDAARDMLGDVQRLQHLTDDLLLLARLDMQIPAAHTSVDLTPLVVAAITEIRRSDITVTSAGLDRPHIVAGETGSLRRMVRNLVHNAEQHAERHISVELSTAGALVQFGVNDDGPGIAPEDREIVFERFVRLDEARSRRQGGSGLGLAIVADVVTAHHGSVSVDTAALGGASFTVDLPAHRLDSSSHAVTA